MQLLEDFRNKYRRTEIWIIGCGPDLDSFPDDFFKDKITIATNWAIIGFPDSTYWCCPRPELAAVMRLTRRSIMHKSIFLFPFISFQNWELTEKESLKILGDCMHEPIFMRWRRLDFREDLFMKYLPKTVKRIMNQEHCLYLGLSVTHCAIQAAIVLGAKKINLIGCDTKCSENSSHAQKRGMSYFYVETPGREYSIEEQQGISPRQLKQRRGTKALAEAFRPFGITIQDFYYNEGYKKI